MSTPLDILLVEDDPTTAMAIQQAIAQLGHMATYAAKGDMAVEMVKRRKPQVAIVSTGLTGPLSGEETSRLLAEAEVPILLLSASFSDAKGLLDLKPLGGLVKPLRDGEMEMILSVAQNVVQERLEFKQKSQVLSGIVDGMLDAVLIVDSTRKVQFANATAARLTQHEMPVGMALSDFFRTDDDGNEELEANLGSAFAGTSAAGSGLRATLLTKSGTRTTVVVILSSIRGEHGVVSQVSLSFRSAPPQPQPKTAAGQRANEKLDLPEDSVHGDNSMRSKAIQAIELRLASQSQSVKHFAVVLLLSQFEMFRIRYGLNNAEKLVHAFSAHLIKSLPAEDRLYQWSNRTIVVLMERERSLDEVRVEMTAFCSRRLDYYLNAAGRSALVTLSASWNLIPLFDQNDMMTSAAIVEQIDNFEKQHLRKN